MLSVCIDKTIHIGEKPSIQGAMVEMGPRPWCSSHSSLKLNVIKEVNLRELLSRAMYTDLILTTY